MGGQTITQFCPLTGLKVPDGKSAELDHPVLVAKMDNTVSSSPQIGLSKADMVVEELVEGGLTRLAAFYYSDIPGNVGPVRSMRASDIGIVSPVHASIVTSGAAARTIALIKGAGIPFYGEGAKGFYRSSRAWRRTTSSSTSTRSPRRSKTKTATPPDYLPWGADKDLPEGHQGDHDRRAVLRRPHHRSGVYTQRQLRQRQQQRAAGDQFPADTVLVLRVKEGDAGYLDPAGNPVPRDAAHRQGQRRCSSTTAGWSRHLAQGQARLADQADHRRAAS